MPSNAIVTKTIVGIIFGSGLLGFMGYGIVNNDIRNTKDHIEIRKEQLAGDKDNREKLNVVKDIVTDIRIEQREMHTILKRMDK